MLGQPAGIALSPTDVGRTISDEKDMTMEIYHSGAAEVPAVAMPEYFTGSGKLELMGALDVASADSMIMLTLDADAHTHWHAHEGGQVLVVTDGTGVVAKRGEEPIHVAPGDVIVTGPDEVHWHGAGPNAPFSTLAVDRGTTTWHGPVEAR
jgi:quercetin dioxygenase-like cupin family protein